MAIPTRQDVPDNNVLHAQEGRAGAQQASSTSTVVAPAPVVEADNREARASFASILFPAAEDRYPASGAPPFFADLNIDQIVSAITAGKDEYDLKSFFHIPLHRVDSVAFRHEVMRDLEDARLLHRIKGFAKGMHAVRERLAELEKKRYYERQKIRWFVGAVVLYGKTVSRLAQGLSAMSCNSPGLKAFREYTLAYVASERFMALVSESQQLISSLSEIRYNVHIRGGRVEVHPHSGEHDYSTVVATAFERFKQRATKAYDFKFSDAAEMNHIEAQILDGVAHLYPDLFSLLARFHASNGDFLDPVIVRFDREIQFYVAYLDHVTALKRNGLSFCYPQVDAGRSEIHSCDGFDMALAGKLTGERRKPVCNDFHLTGPERMIVVSGPNQGGKTTFARTFGQLHYLASLGCPVPGTKARLHLADRIFTHFERREQLANLRGKLEDDVFRIHEILEAATPQSIIIVNEIFASTALRDALFLSKKIAAKIMDLDVPCCWVTFLDEVASLSEKTVSMVSTVHADNPAQRTFKIVRQPADGLAYALSIAEKYRLTFRQIRERVAS